MSTEIARTRVVGNFKKPRRERQRGNSRKADTRPGMSEEHLAFIRRLPCCIPGCRVHPAGTAHHLKSTRERGMGLRSTDQHTLPMCAEHHLYGVERVGSKRELHWFAKHGIEALDLAAALWRVSGDEVAGRNIVEANKSLAH